MCFTTINKEAVLRISRDFFLRKQRVTEQQRGAMQTVAQVIEYKKSVGMPILDSAREAAVIEKNSAYIQDAQLLDYYRRFIQAQMDLSREYQQSKL